jgi:hypothetical protein
MAANKPPADDEVGYGKPPKSSRFRKGESGNPTGRPKGSKNLVTLLEKSLREKVVINENGARKTITKGEAAIKQLVNKATLGDLAAFRLLSALVTSAGSTGPTDPGKGAPAESDQKIMKRLIDKMRKSGEVKDDDDK